MAEKMQELTQPIDLPNFYFNGFQLGLSNADINGLLLLNNQPHMAISMSYTTAKTLSAALNQMVEALESATGTRIMTNQEVAVGIDKLTSEGENDGQPN